jgi:hypothetical protein
MHEVHTRSITATILCFIVQVNVKNKKIDVAEMVIISPQGRFAPVVCAFLAN